ncbi:TraB/GumN family protein [Candidatus Woesearchaeota archaeon]|nr:TraB/GumN family protein [Candidatus Woesearchaeota archaeon]
MMNKNITIIGTSHIAIESIKEVKQFITDNKPDIIAIELDHKRFKGLIGKRQKMRFSDIKDIGIKGFVLNLIGSYIEKKLGKIVGVSPGSEMKIAIQLAKKYKLKVALIDQDISITLKKLTRSITLKEKLTFIKDIIKNIFKRDPLAAKIDLRKVPPQDIVEKMVEKVKKSYPSIHKVLIDERNSIMSNKIKKLAEMHPNARILVIIGAGHKNEVIKLLSGN